jgi:hypothetical protein
MTRVAIGVFIGLSLAGLVAFLRSTPDAYPFGDVAVMEISTLQALRGFVKLGPYSQFGWHHPGPLCFYLLAPFYALAGERSIGMAAGALFINLGALAIIGWVAGRNGGPIVAAVVSTAMVLYLLRIDEAAASPWNPHLVIMPFVALTVLCSAVASGSVGALPVATGLASFVMQTDISTAPSAAILLTVACLAGAARPHQRAKEKPKSLRFWTAVSILVALALWSPPILEELMGKGNLSRIYRFFATDRRPGQSWMTSFLTWAEVTTAVARPRFTVAWGAVDASLGSKAVAAWAVVQVLGALVASWLAWRMGHRFVARLSAAAAIALLAGCWSITRIVDTIGDYQVFWMSALGALTWAAIATVAVTALAGGFAVVRRDCIRGLFLITAVSAGVIVVTGLSHARAYALEQRDIDLRRKVVAVATEQFLVREHVRRPLLRLTLDTWPEAASVILHVYKHHRRLAVEEGWILIFGEVFEPTGREDAELQFATGGGPGDQAVAHQGGLYVRLLRRND